MFSIDTITVFLVFISYIVLYYFLRSKKGLPTNWPIIGMLPATLLHIGDIHNWSVEISSKCQMNFLYKGPWFFKSDILFTADPANVRYIFTSNFDNFPKGPEFKEIFDVFGDAIFNTDGELWKNQRKVALFFLGHNSFHMFLEKTIHHKVENGLVPVLQHVVDKGLIVDLQDVFRRFSADMTCKLATGYDPGALSIEFPEVAFSNALDDVAEAILYRHVFPGPIWKMQRWIGIGVERKMSKARQILHDIVDNYIKIRRQELETRGTTLMNQEDNEEVGIDLLTSYMTSEIDIVDDIDFKNDKFLRDTVLGFMFAGRNGIAIGTTWFFWILSRYPLVECKIREEVNSVMSDLKYRNYKKSTLDKLVYLHAALCETLRLYPPVAFEHKSPTNPDVLPSGHKVGPKMKILFGLYAMGRMCSIWGEDCMEFKPERWITNTGGILHVPSYKFMAFTTGARSCIGKETSFTQMKSLVAAIISHGFHLEVDKGYQPIPSSSFALLMKHGLKVKITRKDGLW